MPVAVRIGGAEPMEEIEQWDRETPGDQAGKFGDGNAVAIAAEFWT